MIHLFQKNWEEHQVVLQATRSLFPILSSITEKIIQHMKQSATLFFMGNGGSAADSQHMAAELIGRFVKERKAIPSIALTTDSSILTSLGNDYDYSVIFSRQLEAIAKSRDVVIGLSTSGNSLNIIKGFDRARMKGCYTIALTGSDGGKIFANKSADEIIKIPSNNTARIQEIHTLILHTICEAIEEDLSQL